MRDQRVTTANYQGTRAPNQRFGGPALANTGNMVLRNAAGLVVDSLNYALIVDHGPTINGDRSDCQPEISADGRTLLFCASRVGGHGHFDIWQAEVDPFVDFNGDRNTDTDDLLTMIDFWETDDSICDSGPMPWGDGLVDFEDLKTFIEHWEAVFTNVVDFH